MATIEQRIAELERRHGGDGVKLILCEDGETKEQARERAGLIGWAGQVIFVSFVDAHL